MNSGELDLKMRRNVSFAPSAGEGETTTAALEAVEVVADIVTTADDVVSKVADASHMSIDRRE
jgi:hypothetical protein